MRVAVRHQLVGFFGGGVKADRVIDIVFDAEGKFFVGAVDGARRRVNQMFGFVMAAGFEDVDEAGDVALGIRARVIERIADAGLRGEMDDDGRLRGLKQFFDGDGVGEIGFDEGKVFVGRKLCEAGFF